MNNQVDKSKLAIILIVVGVIIIAAAILLYYFFGVNKEIVATFNGGNVTRVEYETAYRAFASNYYYYGYSVDEIDDNVLDGIILDKLLSAKATQAGLSLTEEEKTKIEDEFKSEESLQQMASYGINASELKTMYYSMTLASKYIEKLQTEATTEQIKSYIQSTEGEKPDYNLYKTSQVLFSITETTTDAEKTELLAAANKVLARAKAGEDFAKLVEEFKSGTTASAGDVDMTNNDKYAKEYKNAVLTLKAGSVYGSVVKSEFGYHVIKLNSIEENGRLTADTEINYYVNDIFDQYKGNANITKKEDRIKVLTEKFNSELGITSKGTTTTAEG